MSFARFSSDFLMDTFTLVDNLFINEHLPYCDEKQIKVYLYGLYLCSNPSKTNTVEELCARLDMTESEMAVGKDAILEKAFEVLNNLIAQGVN